MKISANELEFDLLYSAVMRVMDEDGKGFLRNQKVMWEATDMTWTERCKRILLYASRLWAVVFKDLGGGVHCDIIASDKEPQFKDIFLSPYDIPEKEIQLLEFHPDLNDPLKPLSAEIDL